MLPARSISSFQSSADGTYSTATKHPRMSGFSHSRTALVHQQSSVMPQAPHAAHITRLPPRFSMAKAAVGQGEKVKGGAGNGRSGF